jgi:TPR repeat protein
MPRSSFIALVLAVASSTASAASLQDGIQAYQHLDFAAAMQILQPYATAGDPKAQRIVGEMYLRGQGVPLSSFVAADWLRQAATKGDAVAQYQLALLYLRGRGVRQDSAQAMKWFRLSADQGNGDAQFCLGKLYAIGEGVPKDLVAAHLWLSLAAITSSENRAARDRDLVAAEMTPEELTQARALARDWRPGTADFGNAGSQ